jgi:hypothetical protein
LLAVSRLQHGRISTGFHALGGEREADHDGLP